MHLKKRILKDTLEIFLNRIITPHKSSSFRVEKLYKPQGLANKEEKWIKAELSSGGKKKLLCGIFFVHCYQSRKIIENDANVFELQCHRHHYDNEKNPNERIQCVGKCTGNALQKIITWSAVTTVKKIFMHNRYILNKLIIHVDSKPRKLNRNEVDCCYFAYFDNNQ